MRERLRSKLDRPMIPGILALAEVLTIKADLIMKDWEKENSWERYNIETGKRREDLVAITEESPVLQSLICSKLCSLPPSKLDLNLIQIADITKDHESRGVSIDIGNGSSKNHSLIINRNGFSFQPTLVRQRKFWAIAPDESFVILNIFSDPQETKDGILRDSEIVPADLSIDARIIELSQNGYAILGWVPFTSPEVGRA